MKEITAALVRAQSEFPEIAKNAEVNAGSRKYNYAKLEDILTAVRPALTKNGLALTQRTYLADGKTYLSTELLHISGERIVSDGVFMPGDLRPQDYGSFSTYARRYALVAILGIQPGGEDDDAQSAQETFQKPQQPVSYKISEKQVNYLRQVAATNGYNANDVTNVLRGEFRLGQVQDINRADFQRVLERFQVPMAQAFDTFKPEPLSQP